MLTDSRPYGEPPEAVSPWLDALRDVRHLVPSALADCSRTPSSPRWVSAHGNDEPDSMTSKLPDWYGDVAKTGLPTTLGIEILELSESRVVATMPVDERTRQPFGILHGGASIALAETVASFGAVALIDRERYVAVGQEINGNHLRPKLSGVVRAVGVPVHVGRTSQVWSIEISDEEGRLVCISRCTMAIVERR